MAGADSSGVPLITSSVQLELCDNTLEFLSELRWAGFLRIRYNLCGIYGELTAATRRGHRGNNVLAPFAIEFRDNDALGQESPQSLHGRGAYPNRRIRSDVALHACPDKRPGSKTVLLKSPGNGECRPR